MSEPLQQFPLTLADRHAELESGRRSLLDSIEAARAHAGPVAEGTWSIAQVGYHLHIAEGFTTRMFQKLLASGERGEVASTEILIEEWERVRKLVGARQGKVQAPERVVPHDAPEIDSVLVLLAESRRALLQALEAADAQALASIYAPHPLKPIGTLTGLGWLSSIAFHDLRHSHQVREITGS